MKGQDGDDEFRYSSNVLQLYQPTYRRKGRKYAKTTKRKKTKQV